MLERIIEKTRYTEMEASHIIKQVLEAVAYLHSKRIVRVFGAVHRRSIVISSRKIFFFLSLEMYFCSLSLLIIIGYLHQTQ